MPHTLEQLYKFFACVVKPLCVQVLSYQFFTCMIKLLTVGFTKIRAHRRWSKRHARLPFKKDECGHAKSFRNIVKNTCQKSPCSNPVALNHFLMCMFFELLHCFKKPFNRMKSGQKNEQEVQKQSTNSWTGCTRNKSKPKFYELHNSMDEIMYFLLQYILNNF